MIQIQNLFPYNKKESLEYWLLDQLIHTFFHKIYIVLTNIADSVSNFYVKSHQTLGSKYLLKRINSNKTRSSSSHTRRKEKIIFIQFSYHKLSSVAASNNNVISVSIYHRVISMVYTYWQQQEYFHLWSTCFFLLYNVSIDYWHFIATIIFFLLLFLV